MSGSEVEKGKTKRKITSQKKSEKRNGDVFSFSVSFSIAFGSP